MSTMTPISTIDYAKARELMVEQQVRPWDVLDKRVLDVLASLPREEFAPTPYRSLAYADLPLPIGHGEFMMKPVVEGRTLQALKLAPSDEVLEIGTGSGYLTACLARLARSVVSLELHADLTDAARTRLALHGHENARVELADVFGYTTDHRFDAICVTGAVAAIPAQLLQWLKPGGRMFVIHGRSPAMHAVIVRPGDDISQPAGIKALFETDLPYLVGAAPVPKFTF